MHINRYRDGFPPELTWITQYDEVEANTGIALGVLKLSAGERHHPEAETETALLRTTP